MQRPKTLLLTAGQMQQVDATALLQGIDSFSLMCAAGKAVSEVTAGMVDILDTERRSVDHSTTSSTSISPASQDDDRYPRIVIVAGPGNNGGDGAIAASELVASGYDVHVLRFAARPLVNSLKPGSTGRSRSASTNNADTNTDSANTDSANTDSEHPVSDDSKMTDADRAFFQYKGSLQDVPIQGAEIYETAREHIEHADIIVDALFGAGLSRPLDGKLKTLVELINRASAKVISVDVPSGLDGNTHLVEGVCIQADVTVTFYRFKPAHFLYPGAALCGCKRLMQIGLSDAQLNPDWAQCLLNEPDGFLQHMPVPSMQGHKFDRGHVLVRSGPVTSTGAARLAAQTALDGGAGLVTISSDRTALPVNAAHLTAVMIRLCESETDWQALLQDPRVNTVVVGPGNGVDNTTRIAVEASLLANKSCILDADALSCWPTDKDRLHLYQLLANCTATAVLTPHDGEFARLFPELHAQVSMSKLHKALAAARQASAVVVLKGADTVIASPDGRSAINASAPPWLATAGAGDVLAGMIASLVAQGMQSHEAACASVWMHGEAAMQLGYPMTAEKLLVKLPSVLHELSVTTQGHS